MFRTEPAEGLSGAPASAIAGRVRPGSRRRPRPRASRDDGASATRRISPPEASVRQSRAARFRRGLGREQPQDVRAVSRRQRRDRPRSRTDEPRPEDGGGDGLEQREERDDEHLLALLDDALDSAEYGLVAHADARSAWVLREHRGGDGDAERNASSRRERCGVVEASVGGHRSSCGRGRRGFAAPRWRRERLLSSRCRARAARRRRVGSC